MKRIAPLCFFLFLSFSALAQNDYVKTITLNGEDTKDLVAPEPKCGWEKFYKKFSNKMYIDNEMAAHFNGPFHLMLHFVVLEDGKLDNITVINDPGYGLGDLAVKTLKKMPHFKPATKNGVPTKADMNFPVTINF